jgi:hypothetical protein
MDIFSHALAGASVGHHYGFPLTGMALGILPDVVLPLKRTCRPTIGYFITHSLLFVGCVTLLGILLGVDPFLTVFATSSHLVLDFYTHSERWSPRLLYPFITKGFGNFEEWEFFNKSWAHGLLLTTSWSAIWIIM